jgi:hypothetical protein
MDTLEGRDAPTLTINTAPGIPAVASVGQPIPLYITVTDDNFSSSTNARVSWGDGVTDTLTLQGVGNNVFRGADSHSYGPAAQGRSFTVLVDAFDANAQHAEVVAGTVTIPAGAAASPTGNTTNDFVLVPQKTRFNSSSGNTKLSLLLKNNSDQTIDGPFYVVLSGLKHSVKLSNETAISKVTSKGNPYLFVPGGQLSPGQSIPFTLSFHNSTGGKVSATSLHTTVFAGVAVY